MHVFMLVSLDQEGSTLIVKIFRQRKQRKIAQSVVKVASNSFNISSRTPQFSFEFILTEVSERPNDSASQKTKKGI